MITVERIAGARRSHIPSKRLPVEESAMLTQLWGITAHIKDPDSEAITKEDESRLLEIFSLKRRLLKIQLTNHGYDRYFADIRAQVILFYDINSDYSEWYRNRLPEVLASLQKALENSQELREFALDGILFLKIK